MKTLCHVFFVSVIAMFAARAIAQKSPADYILPVEATVQTSPPTITLHWTADARAQHFYISRRLLGNGDLWGLIATLPGADTSYSDKGVLVGTPYEYRVIDSTKNDSVYAVFGFLASGIAVPASPQPGAVELIVDNTYSSPLKTEIDRLITDLRAEGWQVIRHDVARTDNVTDIQASIQNDYNNYYNVRTVFLLGHVPVPYSGDIAPDGHVPGSGNHQGAWPADVYYGNWDATWTDDIVNDVTANDPRNKNIPGDGKFDQGSIDAPMDLEVGRVDLYDLPSFPLSDTLLMKQYLDRDHAFRMGQLVVPTRALIDDNFGLIREAGIDIEKIGGKLDTFPYVLPLDYDAPATNGWRNFPPLVGTQNIDTKYNDIAYDSAQTKAGNWFTYLDTAKYLWAYGCGGGWFQGSSGVGTTALFADPGAGALFYMLFGSFFGDWDSPDNFLRAPLATKFGLEDCWAGRPYWFFHPLGMGETFGYCTRLSQDVTGQINWGTIGVNFLLLSDYMVSPSMNGVHVALMGDPTLRMEYLSDPPTALSASVTGNSVKLTWNAPSIKVPGYTIYRAGATGDTLLQINTSPVTGTAFTDMSPLADSNIYVVRAAKLTTTPSGSWWNESGGVTLGVKVTLAGVAESNLPPSELTIRQAPGFLDIHASETHATSAHLGIVDETGREVVIVHDGPMTPGKYNYRVNTSAMPSGAYFVRLVGTDGIKVAKIVIVR
ncbi:MAG TPA: hypothetical protein VFH95_15435 [Candidatus Kapabacteria bacterium]|nr:hypothetical protein [Candidatus Kapabacteria bacterium]